jgi:hypothetical protein
MALRCAGTSSWATSVTTQASCPRVVQSLSVALQWPGADEPNSTRRAKPIHDSHEQFDPLLGDEASQDTAPACRRVWASPSRSAQPTAVRHMVLSGLVAGSNGWVVLGVARRSVGVFGGLVLCATWLCLGASAKASPPLLGSSDKA